VCVCVCVCVCIDDMIVVDLLMFGFVRGLSRVKLVLLRACITEAPSKDSPLPFWIFSNSLYNKNVTLLYMKLLVSSTESWY
jgi:hypothetical protein